VSTTSNTTLPHLEHTDGEKVLNEEEMRKKKEERSKKAQKRSKRKEERVTTVR